MPTFRGEDTVWGLLIGYLYGNGAFVGHPSFALLHAPATVREHFESAYLQSFSYLRVADLLVALLIEREWVPALSRQPTLRLVGLGHQLAGLGREHPRAFAEIMRETLWGFLAKRRGHIERILHASGSRPSYFRQDLASLLRSLDRLVTRPAFWLPRDMVKRFGHMATPGVLQMWLRMLGEFLVAWPELVDASRRLRGERGHLGKTLSGAGR
jgi:hypothetical protein